MIVQTPRNFFFSKTCDCGCLQNKSLHKAHRWWYTSWVYVVMSHESYISFKISSGMSIKHQSKEAAQHIRRRVCTRKVVYISYTTAHWKIICARRFTSSKKINDSYLHPCKKKKKKGAVSLSPWEQKMSGRHRLCDLLPSAPAVSIYYIQQRRLFKTSPPRHEF